MPIDYNALRAKRFAKRHKRIAENLTDPLEKTIAEKTELIESLKAENEKLVAENSALAAENATLKAANESLSAENEKLKKAAKPSKASKTAEKAKD